MLKLNFRAKRRKRARRFKVDVPIANSNGLVSIYLFPNTFCYKITCLQSLTSCYEMLFELLVVFYWLGLKMVLNTVTFYIVSSHGVLTNV